MRSRERRTWLRAAAISSSAAFASAGTLALTGCYLALPKAMGRRRARRGREPDPQGPTSVRRAACAGAGIHQGRYRAGVRANGTLDPETDEYDAHAAKDFTDWRIDGRRPGRAPLSLSMAICALPARTQITRHDCVEGWSCIGEWTGAPLALALAAAKPKPEARYVVFYCADPMAAVVRATCRITTKASTYRGDASPDDPGLSA